VETFLSPDQDVSHVKLDVDDEFGLQVSTIWSDSGLTSLGSLAMSARVRDSAASRCWYAARSWEAWPINQMPHGRRAALAILKYRAAYSSPSSFNRRSMASRIVSRRIISCLSGLPGDSLLRVFQSWDATATANDKRSVVI
jgi:hypothetical protein